VTCNVQPLPREDELCDALDNDCDGFTDEDFYLLGTGCVEGLGECQTTGTVICRADGAGTECDANPPAGVSELCDALDNDCDGDFDEDFANLGETCQVGLGVCTRWGTMVCSADQTQSECSATAGTGNPEICDFLDNDCDGDTNEDLPGVGTHCSIGIGECESHGELTCIPATGAIDCNAQIIDPVAELCDGLDNDCNGFADETFPLVGIACSAGQGECLALGEYECSGDQLSTVCNAVAGTPQTEVCDGLDNNCDGSTDEDFGDLGTGCVVGLGVCTRMGVMVCRPDGTGTQCSVTPGTGSPEACDGLDNDCDGLTDNDIPGTGEACSIGLGECYSEGLTVCQPSGDIVCDATVISPVQELCDDLDNDCDDFTDEDFANKGLSCNTGIGECLGEGVFVCNPAQDGTECDAVAGDPLPEDCDGLDNNCDGSTDEGWVEACSTACGGGWKFCVGGTETECSAPQPAPDDSDCNYFDDDCDGETDEDVACVGGFCLGDFCEVGTGLCYAVGYWVCNDSGTIECNAVEGVPQIEDNEGGSYDTCEDVVDNDCDGDTDGADNDC
jgi:hypothetical protein